MATKRFNEQVFSASVNNKEYTFEAYTTNTRNGFCHTVLTSIDGVLKCPTKVSYYNRTWESFRYESALKRAIEKCAKCDRDELRAIIIDGKKQEEKEKADKFLNAFEQTWNKVSPDYKERISRAVGTVETQEQAETALAAAKMALVFQML